jgi:predicted glutamine amidotransferase
MCRLLGTYGQVEFWQELVLEFRKQAVNGNIPPEEDIAPGHQDGWGMAISNPAKTAMAPLIRQLGSAADSLCYPEVVRSLTSQPNVFLCHLRKASAGISKTLANVQPFFQHEWAFIHNGTVFQAENLPGDPLFKTISDGSDSEHFFHYLLTKLGGPEAGGGQVEKILAAVAACSADYTSLNSILSNGRELFVIRQYRKWADYYSLYYHILPKGVVVCSEIIECDGLNPNGWVLLDPGALLRIHGYPPQAQIEKI